MVTQDSYKMFKVGTVLVLTGMYIGRQYLLYGLPFGILCTTFFTSYCFNLYGSSSLDMHDQHHREATSVDFQPKWAIEGHGIGHQFSSAYYAISNLNAGLYILI